MKHAKNLLSLIAILTMSVACQQTGNQSINWIKSEQECFLTDSLSLQDLSKHDNFLIGKNESYVTKLLNKPSETLLLSRGEKFFVYQLCDSTSKNPSLRIRFNALGLIKESIIVERD